MKYLSKNRINAYADITGGENNADLGGRVTFISLEDGVLVTAKVWGLPEENEGGFFGFHIHEGNSRTGEAFADTGAHYNPDGNPHPEHSGDLPPLLSADGGAYLSVFTNRFRVEEIIGKTVVIHNMADDFRSQPSGNAGEKIGCGVIVHARGRKH